MIPANVGVRLPWIKSLFRIGWLAGMGLLLGQGIAAFVPGMAGNEALWAKVVRVEDGDSIQLEDGRRVRYLGVDAPERGGPGKGEFLAEEAARFNRRLVLGQEVRLVREREPADRYERVLAQVYLKNGLWVNRELVAAGMARVLYQPPNTENFARLLQEQQAPLEARRGIWSRALQGTEAGYPGSERSRKFHRPDCPLGLKLSLKNRVFFKSKEAAYRQGYSPCRVCRP